MVRYFFFLGKSCPELTSVSNLPLSFFFFHSPKPQYIGLSSSCQVLYVSHCHSMATDRQVVWFCTQEPNPRQQSGRHQTLTTRPSGWLKIVLFLYFRNSFNDADIQHWRNTDFNTLSFELQPKCVFSSPLLCTVKTDLRVVHLIWSSTSPNF